MAGVESRTFEAGPALKLLGLIKDLADITIEGTPVAAIVSSAYL